MLEVLLAGARWLHYVCVTLLFGAQAFALYAHGLAQTPSAWRRRIARASGPALAGALVSGVLWFVLTAAGMSGDLNAAADPAALWTTLTQTPFGPLWAARMLLVLLILALLARPIPPLERIGPAALSGVLLASLALTGHAQSQDGLLRLAHEAADALHLLAAGAWIGGLLVLAFIVGQTRPGDQPSIARVLARFSLMGYLAVAVLILSGLVNGLFLIGRPAALITTVYGRLLCVKLALFAAMLGLAVANRWWISPALADGGPDRALWLHRLKRHILAEQALAALVLVVVAVLGVLDPIAS